jgi:hypothetical protein
MAIGVMDGRNQLIPELCIEQTTNIHRKQTIKEMHIS